MQIQTWKPAPIIREGTKKDDIDNDVDGDDLDRIRLITNTATSGDLVNRNDGDAVIKTGNNAVANEDIFHSLTSGEFRMKFKPTNNSFNNTTFTYKVGDGAEYSDDTYTGYININAAPDAPDTTVSTVAAGAESSSNIITDSVTDSDDAAGNLRITGVAAGEEDTTIPDGSVGTSISGSYGTLVLNQDGSYTYTANDTNSIDYGSTDYDYFNFTVKDNESDDDHNATLAGDQNAGSDALDVGQIRFEVEAHSNVAPTAANGTIYINENNEEASAGDRTDGNITYEFDTDDWPITDSNVNQDLFYKIPSIWTISSHWSSGLTDD